MGADGFLFGQSMLLSLVADSLRNPSSENHPCIRLGVEARAPNALRMC
jgi:hypothetical protein